jgi:hypothetical protein
MGSRALGLAAACIGAWLVAATAAVAEDVDARIVIDAERPRRRRSQHLRPVRRNHGETRDPELGIRNDASPR